MYALAKPDTWAKMAGDAESKSCRNYIWSAEVICCAEGTSVYMSFVRRCSLVVVVYTCSMISVEIRRHSVTAVGVLWVSHSVYAVPSYVVLCIEVPGCSLMIGGFDRKCSSLFVDIHWFHMIFINASMCYINVHWPSPISKHCRWLPWSFTEFHGASQDSL